MSARHVKDYPKDPNATLDWTFDWTPWLSKIGDSISSIAWTVPAGLTQESVSNSLTKATIWLSGGTDGTSYEVSARITTVGGRIDDRTFGIDVVSR